MSRIDQAEAVRKGEELRIDALAAYLKHALPELSGSLSVRQFPRGYSNLTYLIRCGDRELVLRRPPFGVEVKSAHDMGREFRVLSGLTKVYARVPQPLLYCEDESVIGAPFYVMQRVEGVVLRATSVESDSPSPAVMAALSLATIDNLAAIHALDYTAAGLADLGRPDGYVERQIRGWTRRYHAAQTDDVAGIDAVMHWLAAHMPAESGASIIHNDYKYDNLILAPDNLGDIRAVLDWEMCTLGDPLMDLGTTLGYWIEPSDPAALVGMFGLTTLPGNLDRSQVVQRYAEVSGRRIDDPLFYYVYGLFKIAVIIQQIYARYRRGHTEDARFGELAAVVEACSNMAVLALEKGRISRLT